MATFDLDQALVYMPDIYEAAVRGLFYQDLDIEASQLIPSACIWWKLED